eukprot:2947388-Rhodomonas_salina.1
MEGRVDSDTGTSNAVLLTKGDVPRTTTPSAPRAFQTTYASSRPFALLEERIVSKTEEEENKWTAHDCLQGIVLDSVKQGLKSMIMGLPEAGGVLAGDRRGVENKEDTGGKADHRMPPIGKNQSCRMRVPAMLEPCPR